LWTTCSDCADLTNIGSHLLPAPLAPRPLLEVMHTFSEVMLAKGMAFDAHGRMFGTDFTPLVGKLVTLTFNPQSPLQVERECVWHDADHLLANGIEIFKEKVCLTDVVEYGRVPKRRAPAGLQGRARVSASMSRCGRALRIVLVTAP
jgi:hypothetical protein